MTANIPNWRRKQAFRSRNLSVPNKKLDRSMRRDSTIKMPKVKERILKQEKNKLSNVREIP